MPQIINLAILKQPVNWFTVFLTLLIASIALHFILKWESTPA